MNRNSSAPQGILILGDAIMHAYNALIEEVAASTGRTGFIIITAGVTDENSVFYTEEIRLNVGRDTIIIDEEGNPLSLHDLEKGMRIDADFSAAMTRSIPPQAYAFRIVAFQEEITVDITRDRVVGLDVENGFLLTGNPYDINDQMIFTISDETMILGPYGRVIPLAAIQAGQMVRVEHAIFQTASIPPQSPAYRVQVL